MLYLCERNTDVLCHSTGLYSCLCASAVFILFCVLCSMAETWVALILLVLSFSTGVLCWFWVFCVSKWVLGSSFLFMWIIHWNYCEDCTEPATIITILILPIHGNGRSFFFLVPSTISFFSILPFLFQRYLSSFKFKNMYVLTVL